MLNALIVDPENLDRCKEILRVKNIPHRCVEEPTWLVWSAHDDSKLSLLPHSVFRDRYQVIGHTESNMVVESL